MWIGGAFGPKPADRGLSIIRVPLLLLKARLLTRASPEVWLGGNRVGSESGMATILEKSAVQVFNRLAGSHKSAQQAAWIGRVGIHQNG